MGVGGGGEPGETIRVLLKIFVGDRGFPRGLSESQKIAQQFLVEFRSGLSPTKILHPFAQAPPTEAPGIEGKSSLEVGLRLTHPQNVLHKMRTKTTNSLRCNCQRALVEIVHLHHAALTNKLGMAMPGMVGAAEGQ